MASKPESNFLQSLRALSATCEKSNQQLVNDPDAGYLTTARYKVLERQIKQTVADMNITIKLLGG